MESLAQQIYTKSGITKENIFEGKRVLHIGAGSKRLVGSITIDILALPGVDVVHDLDTRPWPFPDQSFDIVFGHNVFEHLTDLVASMEEVHRILRPGGRVIITVPYFRSTDAFTDPTHKHFFTSGTLDYFIDDGGSLSGYRYTERRFKKIGFWYGWPQPSSNPLVALFKRFIHRYPKFYDSYLSLLFPIKIVVWELEIIKG